MTLKIRPATAADAPAIAAIYAPIVRDTAISMEVDVPDVDEMRDRIVATLREFPWLVSVDADGEVDGYAYASRYRARIAYQWSVDTTVYVRADCRGRGVGSGLYRALFKALRTLGYFQAFAGIALPNEGSVALHESVGFRKIGVYQKVGFKLGAWHDVGWWQASLQPDQDPKTPRRFGDSATDS